MLFPPKCRPMARPSTGEAYFDGFVLSASSKSFCRTTGTARRVWVLQTCACLLGPFPSRKIFSVAAQPLDEIPFQRHCEIDGCSELSRHHICSKVGNHGNGAGTRSLEGGLHFCRSLYGAVAVQCFLLEPPDAVFVSCRYREGRDGWGLLADRIFVAPRPSAAGVYSRPRSTICQAFANILFSHIPRACVGDGTLLFPGCCTSLNLAVF